MATGVKLIALGGFALLVLGFVGIWAFQRFGAYSFPDRPEASLPEGVEAVAFSSEDGLSVTAWIVRPDPGKPWLISFYGGGATLSGSLGQMQGVIDAGYGLAMVQYRGAQGQPGRPSEMGFAADARAFYDQFDALVGETVPAEARVLHGFSLGGGIASRLATTRPFAGVILHGAPERLCLYFQRRYKVVPFCPLMWAERHDVVEHMPQVAAPVMVVHGQNDRAVPVAEAEANFAAAANPWGLRILPGAHVDLPQHGLAEEIIGFMDAVTELAPAG